MEADSTKTCQLCCNGTCFFDNIFTPIFALLTLATLLGLLTGAWWLGNDERRPYALPLLLLSIIPSWLILWVIYVRSSSLHISAPTPLVTGAYLSGIFAAIPLAVLESFLGAVIF